MDHYVENLKKSGQNGESVKHSVFVNSGSSANLLALTCLKVEIPKKVKL